jgi:hypothetical protein
MSELHDVFFMIWLNAFLKTYCVFAIFRRHVYFTAICIKSNPFAFYFLIILFTSYFLALLIMYNYLSISITTLYDGVVLICGKQFHDRIMSLIRMVWAHKTSTKELKRTVKAMGAMHINFDTFYIFSISLWNSSYSVVCFFSFFTHVLQR